jgi:hypothetical protein
VAPGRDLTALLPALGRPLLARRTRQPDGGSTAMQSTSTLKARSGLVTMLVTDVETARALIESV